MDDGVKGDWPKLERVRVRLDDTLLDALNGWLQSENVEIVYH